jgi:site-specific DNA recombinase
MRQSLQLHEDGTDARSVFAYYRHSDSHQHVARQEINIPARHEQLPDGLSANELVKFYDEGISAWSGKPRPGFAEMCERIERGEASALIIDTSSRLTRGGRREAMKILWSLIDADCRLFTAQGREYTDDVAGWVSLIVDAEADQQYSNALSHNTATGIAAIVKRGYWPFGQKPFGYDAIGPAQHMLLTANDDAPRLVTIFESFRDGAAIEKIARAAGLDRARVRRMLANPVYIGRIRHLGRVFDGLHQPLISTELFNAAQERLARGRSERVDHPAQNPFGNRVRCSKCGATCKLHISHRENGIAYYRCSKRGCMKYDDPAEYVDVSIVLGMAQIARLLFLELVDPKWAIVAPSTQIVQQLTADLDQLGRAEDEAHDLLGTDLGGAKLRQRLTEIKRRQREVETQLALHADDGQRLRNELQALQERFAIMAASNSAETVSDSFVVAWSQMSTEERRSLVRDTIRRIDLTEDKLLIHFNAGIRPLPVPRLLKGRRDWAMSNPLRALGFGLSGRGPPSVFSLSGKCARVCHGTESASCQLGKGRRLSNRGNLSVARTLHGSASRTQRLRAGADLREDPEARLAERELVELRIDAPEVVLPALVARLHLDAAHRKRPPASTHRAELAALLRLEHEHEIDLHVEHLLQAPDVGPPHLLERVEERTSPRDARRRVHHLVAMNPAAPAPDLILRMEWELLRNDLKAPHRADIFRADAPVRKT